MFYPQGNFHSQGNSGYPQGSFGYPQGGFGQQGFQGISNGIPFANTLYGYPQLTNTLQGAPQMPGWQHPAQQQAQWQAALQQSMLQLLAPQFAGRLQWLGKRGDSIRWWMAATADRPGADQSGAATAAATAFIASPRAISLFGGTAARPVGGATGRAKFRQPLYRPVHTGPVGRELRTGINDALMHCGWVGDYTTEAGEKCHG
jgi:hypothetical protein